MPQTILRHARLALVLSLAMVFAAGQGLTEKEVISQFLSEHPQSKELQAAVALMRAETHSWTLWPNPSVSFSREGAGLAEFVQAQQQLPINGRLQWLRQAGEAAVRSVQSEGEGNRWQAISMIRLAFFDLLAAQERQAAIQSSMQRLKEVLRILGEREREGEGSTYDRLRAERELSELGTDLAVSVASAEQSRGRLAAYISPGRQGGPPFQAVGNLRSRAALPPLAEMLRLATEAHAELKAQKHLQQQLIYQGRAAERLRIPDPIVAIGVKRGELGPGDTALGSYVAVTIPIPIFNRGTTEVERFRAEAERAVARREILERRIRGEIAGLYAALEARRAVAMDYSNRIAAQGEQLETITRTAYEENELGILGLLDSLRVSAQARMRLIDLNAAAKLVELELEQAAGAPILNPEVMP